MPTAKAKDFKGTHAPARRPAQAGARCSSSSSSLLAVVSVTFAVVGPKILGHATNILFEGVVSKQIPAGVTQAQAVAGLRAKGQDRIADMLSSMTLHPGQGVDFDALGAHAAPARRRLPAERALRLAAGSTSWPAWRSAPSTGCGGRRTRSSPACR